MKRAAVIVADAVSGDRELVIETREVEKSLAVIEAFKAALHSDPLALAPAFDSLDRSIDEGVIYHDLRPSERRVRDADPKFQPKITQKSGAV